MKLFKIIAFCISVTCFFTSCKPSNKIAREFEKRISKTLTDPTSYRLVNIELTVFEWQKVLKNISIIKSMNMSDYSDIFVEAAANYMKDGTAVNVWKIKFRSKSEIGLDVLETYILFTDKKNKIVWSLNDKHLNNRKYW